MVRPAARFPGVHLTIPASSSANRRNNDGDSSSALPSPMSIGSIDSISNLPLYSSKDSRKRRLSFEEPETKKRLKFTSPQSQVGAATIKLDDCLAALEHALPAKFGAHFEKLMKSNTTAADDWTLPAHHRFVAALCQSVQECVDEFRLSLDIHAVNASHVDALFQHALRAVGKLAAKSGEEAPLNRFLGDPEHAAYREMVEGAMQFKVRTAETEALFADTMGEMEEDPAQFKMRTVETEALFAQAMDKIRRLVPGYEEDASEMWKLCIDPQTIALLKRKNIDADAPLIGRFMFEGERHFLHNMACGWDFIADAAMRGQKLTLQFLDEINTVCTGRPAATDSVQFEEGGFALLLGHTASPKGLKKLEETVASLQAKGLDVKLLKPGKYPGTDLDYYEWHTEVNNEHDPGLLRDWKQKCIDEHQAHAKDLEGDELTLHDLELVIKLNQAHVFPDGNIRTCHLLLNFFRLSRGEKPFMFADPNVMDAHTADELLQKMKAALANRVDLPAHPVKTAVQAALLSQLRQRGSQPARKPKRKIPKSREYLAFLEHMQSMRARPHGVGYFNDFTKFFRDRGLTLQELKQSPATYLAMRRAYLGDSVRLDNRQTMEEKTSMLTHLSAYLFPELDVSKIVDKLVKEGKAKETARGSLKKPLWDLQEYLHGRADGPRSAQALLGLEPATEPPSPEQMRAQFLATYDDFLAYMEEEGKGATNVLLTLKQKLAAAFFPSDQSAEEEALLNRFEQRLAEDGYASVFAIYVAALNNLKSKKDGVSFVELQGDMAQFVALCSEHQDKSSNAASALNHLGRFLFPEAKAMKVFDDLMNTEFSEKKNKGRYLAAMWKLESALRAKNIEGFEGLLALAPEDGIAHIRAFMVENRKNFSMLDIDALEEGIIAKVFPGHQKRGNVQQDIEDLKAFIISTSQQKNAGKAISGYKPLLEELRKMIEPAGWPDRKLGEFLDFRKTVLFARNESFNPVPERGNSFFNLMGSAAQQRYPALHEFVTARTSKTASGSRNIAINGMLAFFTYLREARREEGMDVDGFLSDINPESIEAFLENKTYILPKSSLLSKDRFRQLILSFPEFLSNKDPGCMERPAAAAHEA